MMESLLDMLRGYFQFSFVRYALVAGVLIALCSSLLGVTLVLRRLSFIGNGLSHVAFGAMAAATVLNVAADMLVVLPATALCAVLLLRARTQAVVRADAALAMLSVAALALGYLMLNVFSKSANLSGDVCSTLFGSTSILTLTALEVWLCVGLSVATSGIFLMFYHKIFAVTFDADFATATGVPSAAYDLLIAVVAATVIVLAMHLVGSLLTSALIVFPALSAMRVFKSYRGVVLCASTLSVACAALGIVVSILASTPVGATIVTANAIAYLAFGLIGRAVR